MARVPGGRIPGGTESKGGVPTQTPFAPNGNAKTTETAAGAGMPAATSATGFPAGTKKDLETLLSDIAKGQLQYNLQRIRGFVTQSHLSKLTPTGVQGFGTATDCILRPYFAPSVDVAIYKLCALYYDENESIYEKITSIYTALNMINAAVAIIVSGTGAGCDVYMAVTISSLTANEVLANSMKGLFPGSILKRTGHDTSIAGIIGPGCNFIQSVAFTPARRKAELSRDAVNSAQGLEKIVEALRGKEYTIVLLATSMCGKELQSRSANLEQLSTLISTFEKQSRTITDASNASTSLSEAKTFSDSVSETLSKSYGSNYGDSRTHGRGGSHGYTTSFFGVGFTSNSSSSDAVTISNGTTSGTAEAWGKVHTKGVSEGFINTSGTTHSFANNYTQENKTVQRIQGLIDTQLDRLDVGMSRGMWECACYVCAGDAATVTNASGIVASTLSGDAAKPLPVFCNLWSSVTQDNSTPDAVSQIIRYLNDLRHPVFELGSPDERVVTIPAVMVNGLEIGSFLPLPRKSLPSVSVRTMAEFARNISYVDEKKQNAQPDFTFGNIVHMHHDENIALPFFTNLFSSHVFITGASGSGKSNTCYSLLQKLHNQSIPFLVIEPVKGDYKKKLAAFQETQVFTTINDSYRMLRINPFAFPENSIKISAHIDRLRDTICACWPLYGPMPGMLKKAFELAYQRRGWDLKLSAQVFETERKYPNFADLAAATEEVIRSAGYSQRNESDYRGALLIRITSLMSGIERDIFSDNDYVSDRELFDQNAIVDLSHIGSPESLSLIMGLLVIKLREYRMSRAQDSDQPTQHVTVLEEAHNLLQRCSTYVDQESGNSQGKAVGEIVKCIAEMRTYGESFMIVDQSPSAVDPAVMRNTAIKIVMRLQGSQDIQSVADAMSLTEAQMREISRLSQGLAIVNQSEWAEPVMARMGGAWKSPNRRENIKPCSNTALLRVRSMVAAYVFWCYRKNLICDAALIILETMLDELEQEPDYKGIGLGYKKDILLKVQHLVEEYTALAKKVRDENASPLGYRPKQYRLVARFLSSLLLMDDMVYMMPELKRKKSAGNAGKTSGEQSLLTVAPVLSEDCIRKWKNAFLEKLYRYYVLPYEYQEETESCVPLNGFRGQAEDLRQFMMWYVADQHEQKEHLLGNELLDGLKIRNPS